MDRTDSSSTMASLVAAMYDERSDDESGSEKAASPTPVDNISDEEGEEKESSQGSRPSSRPFYEDENSSSSHPDPEPVKPPLKRKPTRLVSYGPDEVGGDSDSDEPEEEGSRAIVVDQDSKADTTLDAEQASSLSRSVQNKTADEIELPSEPPGKCPRQLQDKITKLYERMRKERLNLNSSIKCRKDFRNPSIYEKLIEFCGIDEKGTNYPPDVFDPHSWGKESFYDALDKAQKTEMEKREKERKERTKIEFVTGTKKQSTDAGPDEKKRKSKWDTLPPAAGSRPGVINPTVSSLTSSATGTKSTVIPAVGNITKKTAKS